MRTRTSGPTGAAGASGMSKRVTPTGAPPAVLDQLDPGHGGVVALAGAELEDARVAAVAVDVARPDLGEELVRHLAVAQVRDDLPDVVDLGVAIGRSALALASVVTIPSAANRLAARLAIMSRWWEAAPPKRRPFLGVAGIGTSPSCGATGPARRAWR